MLPDGSTVMIANHQIMLWLSLSPVGLDTPPNESRPFPAILDTGFNHGFLLQRQHFEQWTGYPLDTSIFPVREHLRVYGKQANIHEADLWLHRNVAGRRDRSRRTTPTRLQLDLGIVISPVSDQPRLPLLGLVAIRKSGLKIMIDGGKGRVSLRV